MKVSKYDVLHHTAKFLTLLSDAPSYGYSISTSGNEAFHLSDRFGMTHAEYQALLIAANLARYKCGKFCILVDQ